MRKTLSLVLAGVLLFSCILLPATATQAIVTTKDDAAPTTARTSVHTSATGATIASDCTTADDAKNLILIVTEYLSDTKAHEVGPIAGGVTTTASYNAYQYIEIYNSGDVAVDLYKIAIAVSSDAKDANGNKYWSDLHQFNKKMSLRAGSIYNGVSFYYEQSSYSSCKAENPNTAVLEPGETAVIWFWNDFTRTIASKLATSPGAVVNGVYHKGFKDFYGMDDDALVVAVYAGSDANGSQSATPTAACDRFMLNTSTTWTTYGLIDESGMGANGWTVDTPAWTATDGYNDRILALFGWGAGTHHGICAAENKATVYVPANVTPDVFNKYQTNLGSSSFTPANDYVALKGVIGYKEMGVAHGNQIPTPGVVPAWQLAYIAASKGETLDAAAQTAINAFVMSAAPGLPEVEDRPETKIEVQLIPREQTSD